MSIAIKTVERKDFDAARRFAVQGMHLHWYATGKLELYLYSWYFWYMELLRATRILGAYSDDKLVGVLLADMKDEPKAFRSFFACMYVAVAEFVIRNLYSGSAGAYHETNQQMLRDFLRNKEPDGEIIFFAIDPETTGKGVGTILLNELARQEQDKLIYLFTDSGSTYQFYQKREFEESGKRDITLNIDGENRALTCFLFSKRL